MRRIRPWVKKTLLVSIIIVAIGAGLSVVAERHGTDVMKVVRVSQDMQVRPEGSDRKLAFRGGEGSAVPAPRGEVAEQAPKLREGGVHIDMDHEHDLGPAAAVGGTILLALLLFIWLSKRAKRSRVADGANVLASIPTASDFLDQWEIQQNQTKESK